MITSLGQPELTLQSSSSRTQFRTTALAIAEMTRQGVADGTISVGLVPGLAGLANVYATLAITAKD